MSRTPYAGRVLVAEVLSENPDAEVDWSGEADGLGVDRKVRFDQETSKWLQPALEMMGDERIVDMNLTEAGYLHVTFSHRSALADSRQSFYVDQLRRMTSSEKSVSGTAQPDLDESTEPTPEPTEDDLDEDYEEE